MVLAIGFVLVAVYVAYLMLTTPPPGAAEVGFLFVVAAFVGSFVYSTERERQPRRTTVNAENEE